MGKKVKVSDGQPRYLPAQTQPTSSAQSGSAGSTAGAFFDSATNTLINGGQFTAAANVNRNVTINISEGAIPQAQPGNSHSRQTTNRSRRRKRGPMQDPGPAQRSNEIYERHLRLKKRGHPLWIPQSNMVLPIPYRAHGVRVGDVGIFTEDGGFDFLFNICVPRDDPINPEELPDNFVPICPSIKPTDIRKFAQFSPGSYLASSSVAECRTTEQSSGLTFESSESEGAILTMPEGSCSEDLRNVSRLREYIAVHAEDWYKFVNGSSSCGCEAQNGDLRVVVGCDKTTSWGIATFSNSSLSQDTKFRLKFSALGEQPSECNTANKYRWEHSGIAEVRIGPGQGENEELGETDSNRLRNQCLFLRTLNVTLSENSKVWREVFPLTVNLSDQNDSQSGMQDQSMRYPHGGGTGRAHAQPSQSNSSQNLPSQSHNALAISTFDYSLHPSKIINQYLLKQVPYAKFAVTHDRDWSGIIGMNSCNLNSSELLSTVFSMNDIVLDKYGLAFLELKEKDEIGMLSEEVKIRSLNASIRDGTFALDQYLFGFTGDDWSVRLQDLRNELQPGLTNQPIPMPSSLTGHPERPLSLDELPWLRNGGFDPSRRQSIVNLRAESTSFDENPRSRCLLRLADALSRRYSQWAQRDDLEEAIECYKEAHSLSSMPFSNYHKLETLLGLCSSLYQRFYLLGNVEDLKDLLTYLDLQCTVVDQWRFILAPVNAWLGIKQALPNYSEGISNRSTIPGLTTRISTSSNSPVDENPVIKSRRHACMNCRTRKLKCRSLEPIGNSPCERCIKRKLVCEYHPINHETSNSQLPSNSSTNFVQERTT